MKKNLDAIFKHLKDNGKEAHKIQELFANHQESQIQPINELLNINRQQNLDLVNIKHTIMDTFSNQNLKMAESVGRIQEIMSSHCDGIIEAITATVYDELSALASSSNPKTENDIQH